MTDPRDRRRTAITIIVVIVIAVYIRTAERWDRDAGTTTVAGAPASDRIPVAPPTTVYPREAAGFGALFLAAVFLLLYVYRRRTFIIQWTRGWFYLSAAMFILARSNPDSPSSWGVAASGLLTISSAFTLIKSGESLRALARNRRLHGWLVLLCLAWYVLARLFISRSAAFGSAAIILVGLLALACYHYWRLARDQRLFGAGVISAMLAVVAASNVVVAVSVRTMLGESGLTLGILLTTGGCYTAIALGMFVLVFEEMTVELRETNRGLESAQDELRRLAITDPLTDCYNRHHLDEVVRRELKRHRRFGIPLSLLFVDVDRFKQINDTEGHEAGDRVLVQVAGFLRTHVREYDMLFRWGGDEFLILMSCGIEEARNKSAALKTEFQRAIADHHLPRTLGLSIGTAAVPPDTTDILPLVREADEEMYKDKRD